MTRWFGNIKIRGKLFIVYGVLMSIMVVFAVYVDYQVSVVTEETRELINFYQLRHFLVKDMTINTHIIRNIEFSEAYLREGKLFVAEAEAVLQDKGAAVNGLRGGIVSFREAVIDDVSFSESERQVRLDIVNRLDELLASYLAASSELETIVENGGGADAIAEGHRRVLTIGNNFFDTLGVLQDIAKVTTNSKVDKVLADMTRITNTVPVITIGTFAVSFLVLQFAIKSLTRPILKLKEAVTDIAAGNLSHQIKSESHDEIGLLADTMRNMVDTVLELNKTMKVMDHLDFMISIVDTNHNIVYINDKMANAYGLDRADCLNKKCHETFYGVGTMCSYCMLAPAPSGAPPVKERNLDYVWDERLGAWLGGKIASIDWVDGSPVWFHCFIDKTMEKNYEESLYETKLAAEAASDAKSTFLASMSHELRTPLNVIIGLTDLTLEEEGLPPFVQKNLQSVGNAGNTLLSIVNDILDISKIESGKLTLVPVEYQLPSLVNDTVTLLNTYIGEKPITFSLHIDENLPFELYGDELRIKQIFNNLLSNAVKYTHAGEVSLSVSCERDARDKNEVWMYITVRDTGIGIKEADLKNLFAEYFQADTRTNRKTEGTGLGLAITRTLTEMMGGDISVESEYGQGSTFRVRLRQGFVSDMTIGPDAAHKLGSFTYHDVRRQTSQKLVRVNLSRAHILIVDDMQNNLDVAAGLLSKYKLRVDCLTNGAAAVEKIKLNMPVYDAVFMDHMMPGMDGIETVKAIRALGTPYARDVPIIALTANAISGTEQLFFENDFQDYLSKPIDIMRLDAVLKRWLHDKVTDCLDDTTDFAGKNNAVIDIPGVNAAKGITQYRGDKDIYISVLRSYANNMHTVLDSLRHVAADTLANCVINAHGLKGASGNICAEHLQSAAAELEAVGRAGNEPGFTELAAPVLAEAERLIADIKAWLAVYDETHSKPVLKSPDRATLAALKQACEAYDVAGIDAAMDTLEAAEYETGGELVAWLREKADIMELDEVIARLTEEDGAVS